MPSRVAAAITLFILSELLFVLAVLGDDRAIEATNVAGQRLHYRDARLTAGCSANDQGVLAARHEFPDDRCARNLAGHQQSAGGLRVGEQ